jgi:hypothetical protein
MIPGESVKIKTDDDDIYAHSLYDVTRLKIFNVETQRQRVGSQKGFTKASKKSSGAALVLSIFPGGGQFYDGQPVKGLLFLTIESFGSIMLIIEATKEKRHLLGEEENGGSSDRARAGFYIILFGRVISMTDAYFSAVSINKEIGYSALEFPIKKDVALSISSTINDYIELEAHLMLNYRF